ncbi:hypothetical protein D3C84_1009020 [compost metagenome]
MGQVGADHRDPIGPAPMPAPGGLSAIFGFPANGGAASGMREQTALGIDDGAVFDPDLHVIGLGESQAPPGTVVVSCTGQRVHGLAATDQQQA